mmetsp:Transcript_1209/g.3195  ORF Transcript_1209/g.3195 Transcript_1209/m.3195 type:complete len:300 (-) Transcript_1209:1278-2177(-)
MRRRETSAQLENAPVQRREQVPTDCRVQCLQQPRPRLGLPLPRVPQRGWRAQYGLQRGAPLRWRLRRRREGARRRRVVAVAGSAAVAHPGSCGFPRAAAAASYAAGAEGGPAGAEARCRVHAEQRLVPAHGVRYGGLACPAALAGELCGVWRPVGELAPALLQHRRAVVVAFGAGSRHVAQDHWLRIRCSQSFCSLRESRVSFSPAYSRGCKCVQLLVVSDRRTQPTQHPRRQRILGRQLAVRGVPRPVPKGDTHRKVRGIRRASSHDVARLGAAQHDVCRGRKYATHAFAPNCSGLYF